MRALDRPLEQRPETLDALHMMLATHPFIGRMIDGTVLVAAPCQRGVGLQFIGADSRILFDVSQNMRLHRCPANIGDYARHQVSAALHHTEHGRLASGAAPTFAGALAADHRLVDFNMGTATANRRIAINLANVLADFVAHAPRRFVAYAQLALQFLGGHAMAGRREQVDRIKPLLQRRMRPIEERPRHRAEAMSVLTRLGASARDVRFPSPDAIVRDWTPLCGVQSAVAHEATYPSRASDYGSVLAGLLELGRGLSGFAVTKILLRRATFRGQLAALFRDIDLLVMPVMNVAAPSLADMAAAGRAPAAVEARIRFTAPFDMSGHPTLTLPGGKTADGLPVGFQIVGRHMEEDLLLRAGYAFQQATDWHKRRPPV